MFQIRLAVCAGGVLLAGAGSAMAGTVALDGFANGSSAYYEYFSDAFFRMDLVEAPPNETQQRFHLISDPGTTIGSAAFDGFPNDNDFRLGSVSFDESGLVGGTGTAPITGMTLGIGEEPGNPGHVNYGRWTDIVTTVNTFSGSVELVAGQPVSMTLDSTVTVSAAGGAIVATGEFDVAGDQFSGLISTPGTEVVWDFSGVLNTVPEPASLGLLLLGASLLGARRGR